MAKTLEMLEKEYENKEEDRSYLEQQAVLGSKEDAAAAWDENGNVLASRMYTDAQELGQNAMFTINGTSMIATSNTITSDISRIEGVTLTLKRANTEEDGETTLKVAQNSTELIDAVKGFVESYNNFVSKIDSVTAQGADLHGETSLTSLKNTIRNYANGSNDINGGVYKLLSDIGISTGDADGNNLSTDTNKLKFNEEKFLQALQENPDSVKSILAGDTGILNMMESTVEQSLKANVGFFDVKTSTLDNDIKKTNEKITRQNTSISAYKTQLEKKFQAMEQMILSMQKNYSSFLTQ